MTQPNAPETSFMNPEQPWETREFPTAQADALEDRLRQAVAPTPNLDSARQGKPIVRMVVDEKPKIEVEPPPVTPMETEDSFSLDLPSRFAYYDFKDLYCKPLKLPQLAKIAKAHETRDLQVQVEAISSLLSTQNGRTNIAFDLTMADYVATLYWLRMVSYPKQQIRHVSQCMNEAHLAEVKAGTKPPESLRIETVVFKADLKTRYLDSIPDPSEYSMEVDGVTIPFGPETLRDTLQFMSHPEWQDEEFQFKSRIAAVIKLEKATGKVWTWDQKIKFVDTYVTPYDASKAMDFADMMDDYGIIETIQTHCKGCGSKGVSQLSADPLMFLQPKF